MRTRSGSAPSPPTRKRTSSERVSEKSARYSASGLAASAISRSVARLWAGLVIAMPFGALFGLTALLNILAFRSPVFYAIAGAAGAVFIALGRSPLVSLGQRWARWTARQAVIEFEKRAGKLRARQLALLDANKPLPRPR